MGDVGIYRAGKDENRKPEDMNIIIEDTNEDTNVMNKVSSVILGFSLSL